MSRLGTYRQVKYFLKFHSKVNAGATHELQTKKQYLHVLKKKEKKEEKYQFKSGQIYCCLFLKFYTTYK